MAFVALAALLGPAEAAGQISTDGSVGPVQDLSGPFVQIPEALGSRRGGNLFHSFKKFNVQNGQSVFFTGSPDLANVISRVTGGDPSKIDGGLVSLIPNADFWFVNPNGVLFGPEAVLSMPKGLHVSTADELRFGDGSVFSAQAPETGTLTVAEPTSFGFLGGPPGRIAVEGSLLGAGALSLVAGDVAIEGAFVSAGGQPGGTIRIIAQQAAADVPASQETPPAFRDGAVVIRPDVGGGTTGVITLDADGAIVIEAGSLLVSTTTPDGRVLDNRTGYGGTAISAVTVAGPSQDGGVRIAAPDIRLEAPSGSAGAFIASFDIGGAGPGPILVEAERLTIAGGAIAGFASEGAAGGRIDIAADEVRLTDGTIGAAAIPDLEFPDLLAGDVRITARALLHVAGAGGITTLTTNARPGGSIALEAGRMEVVDGAAVDARTTSPAASGVGGSIAIEAGEVLLARGGAVSASSAGAGAAGNVGLAVQGRLRVDNGFIGTDTRSTAPDAGPAGSVTVEAGLLELVNEGRIFNGTAGPGAGGPIGVRADTVTIDGAVDHQPAFNTGISSASQVGSSGAAGAVSVDARVLTLRGTDRLTGAGADISSSTAGTGRGGDVRIAATERLAIDDAFVGADSRPPGSGPEFRTAQAGSVEVRTGRLELTNEGRIFNGTSGAADGGPLDVSADTIAIDGRLDHVARFTTGIGSSAQAGSTGQAGRVEVRARGTIELRSGGVIESSSLGAGNAGAVRVTAGGPIEITGSRDGTRTGISTVVQGAAGVAPPPGVLPQGGTIQVRAPAVRLRSGATISAANMAAGDAGSIGIDAGERLELDRSSITTDAVAGGGGRITISARELVRLGSGGLVASSVTGDATTTAGDIAIDPRFVILDEGSAVRANATTGRGGNITISTDHLVTDATAAIDASAGPAGISGTVVTSTEAETASSTLAIDPAVFLGADRRLTESCAATRASGPSSFGPEARGGLPPRPDQPQPAFYDLAGPSDGAEASGTLRLAGCAAGG